jgi:hypothetical protein
VCEALRAPTPAEWRAIHSTLEAAGIKTAIVQHDNGRITKIRSHQC